MSTQKYQLFFVIGLSMERPYNSIQFWPSAQGNEMPTNKELPIQTMPTRRIYEVKA